MYNDQIGVTYLWHVQICYITILLKMTERKRKGI